MAANYTCDGYHSVTPYLIVRGAPEAIEYYKKALNATELFRLTGPDGRIGHAEIKVGDSPVMLAEESLEMGFKSPSSYGGTPVSLMVYVPDVDAQFKQAIAAGGTVVRPVMDQFYGDRSGTLVDPYGHTWTLSTHKEDLSPEETAKRFKELYDKQPS